MSNQELYDAALEAIIELHDDTSVPKEQAIENLETLREEIDIMLAALES